MRSVLIGTGGPAHADPSRPAAPGALPPGWSIEDGKPTWTVHLSAPVDELSLLLVAWPVEGEPELSTTDVDPGWFRSRSFGQNPEPSRPLSVTGVSVNPRIGSGPTSAEATLPTITDTLAEPAEHVRLRVFVIPPDFFSDPVELSEVRGTVTDR